MPSYFIVVSNDCNFRVTSNIDPIETNTIQIKDLTRFNQILRKKAKCRVRLKHQIFEPMTHILIQFCIFNLDDGALIIYVNLIEHLTIEAYGV